MRVELDNGVIGETSYDVDIEEEVTVSYEDEDGYRRRVRGVVVDILSEDEQI